MKSPITHATTDDSIGQEQALDRLLERTLPTLRVAHADGTGLPVRIDIHRLVADTIAENRGAIPLHFSERETRRALARDVARYALETALEEFDEGGARYSGSRAVHAIVARYRDGDLDTILDKVAAAILMPTQDIRLWAERLSWREDRIADSYAVPKALAVIRLNSLKALAPA